MATMYDATNCGNIPADAAAAGGYINGLYKWTMACWQRFAGLWVPIWVYIPGRTIDGHADGLASAVLVRDWLGLKPGSTIVLDVEAGDMGPISRAYADAWALGVRDLGFSPTLYTSRSTWYHSPLFDDFWIADYTQQPHVIPGAASDQYADPGPYDLSLDNPGWPRRPGTQPQGVPVAATPAITEPIGPFQVFYVTDPSTGKPSQQVFMTGATSGRLYHKWWVPGIGWALEVITDATA